MNKKLILNIEFECHIISFLISLTYFPHSAFIYFLHEAYITQGKGPEHTLNHEQNICEYYQYEADGP